MTRVLICFCVLTAATTAYAQEQGQPMIHVGAATQSCGKWLGAREDQKKTTDGLLVVMMSTSWIQGYLWGATTGLSLPLMMRTLAQIPDMDALEAWVDKYCRDNPLNSLMYAAQALHVELVERATPPKPH